MGIATIDGPPIIVIAIAGNGYATALRIAGIHRAHIAIRARIVIRNIHALMGRGIQGVTRAKNGVIALLWFALPRDTCLILGAMREGTLEIRARRHRAGVVRVFAIRRDRARMILAYAVAVGIRIAAADACPVGIGLEIIVAFAGTVQPACLQSALLLIAVVAVPAFGTFALLQGTERGCHDTYHFGGNAGRARARMIAIATVIIRGRIAVIAQILVVGKITRSFQPQCRVGIDALRRPGNTNRISRRNAMAIDHASRCAGSDRAGIDDHRGQTHVGNGKHDSPYNGTQDDGDKRLVPMQIP